MKGNRKIALVTGILGQDGSYAAELLVSRGYEVHGISREKHNKPYANWIEANTTLHFGDMTDEAFLDALFAETTFGEVYNYAAISDLATAKKFPEETWKINHNAVGFLFTKASQKNPKVHLFQASSSQMFDTVFSPQNENTPFLNKNSYAEAKIAAHKDFVVGFREKGMFACSGFLFNHESPRREERFVTGKISRTLTRIKLGIIDTPLELGNMEMERDWSFAGDFVEGAHSMLQASEPRDYILASGATRTVRQFVELTAKHLNLSISWQGEGVDETAIDETGKVIVTVNKDFYAPKEGFTMVGDISKIKKDLGWEPKVSFDELVKMMAEGALLELKTTN